MKLLQLISIFMLLASGNCFAQEKDSIYNNPNVPAAFPGGRAEMNKFFIENIGSPSAVEEECPFSKTLLKFIVEKDGKISDVEIVRANAECSVWEKEIIRVIYTMPRWIPAQYQEKTVRSYFYLPLYFHPSDY